MRTATRDRASPKALVALFLYVLLRHVHKRRSAGPSIEVFVSATGGEVCSRASQVNRNGTGRMRQIPDGQSAGVVSAPRDRLHVMNASAPVVDLGEHDHGNLIIDRARHFLRRHQLQRVTPVQHPYEALRNVQIGGEISRIRQNDAAPGVEIQRRRQALKDFDRQCLTDHHAAWRCADDSTDAIAELAGLCHPTGAVPALDQLPTPVLRNQARQCPARAHNGRTERVAVQIDHARRKMKQRTSPCEIGHRQAPSVRASRTRLLRVGRDMLAS